ncbi:hypothetical protein [Rhizobium sp. RU36D]|uniref:hypothetical protein n=1 Tax=Rhizobium sp. RU36D TaxID=1907415 RepID=UPI0009D86038|nr:hypothetical protein [Rhizobium sp. RU36D]SMD07690.1 hypothetical protein SAMN05880593_119108 [Rhizobium sp. RU36D]
MSKQVVEYDGIPVGITVPEGDRLKFIAVKYPVIELDGGFYHDIAELRSAISNHLERSDSDDGVSVSASAAAERAGNARNDFKAA